MRRNRCAGRTAGSYFSLRTLVARPCISRRLNCKILMGLILKSKRPGASKEGMINANFERFPRACEIKQDNLGWDCERATMQFSLTRETIPFTINYIVTHLSFFFSIFISLTFRYIYFSIFFSRNLFTAKSSYFLRTIIVSRFQSTIAIVSSYHHRHRCIVDGACKKSLRGCCVEIVKRRASEDNGSLDIKTARDRQ